MKDEKENKVIGDLNFIYFHINPVTNQIFYVGKGKKKRSTERINRNKHWKNTVNKYGGFIVDIIENNLTEKEAFDREVYWIKRIGRKDLGLGPLVNMTDGGEGISGKVFSAESKKKMSESAKKKPKITKEHQDKINQALKGRTPWNKGIKSSEETKRKISESLKGNQYAKGYKHTEETKQLLSKLNAGENNKMYGKNNKKKED